MTPGPGVDSQGMAVVDPTANVQALNEAGNKRQDDLREAEGRHIRELMQRDREHARELRIAEAARLDAIRVVDVNAVQRAAEVMATQATTLANVVATSAEALRTQVATTATGNATALAAALDPIVKDIADLRRVQYEAAGNRVAALDSRDVYRASSGKAFTVASLVVAALSTLVAIVLGVVAAVR